MNPNNTHKRGIEGTLLLLFLVLILATGCSKKVEHPVAKPTFAPTFFATPSESSGGYTIAGLKPGNALADLQADLQEGQSIEGEFPLTLSDTRSGIEVDLIVNEDSGKIVEIKGQRKATLEKDGQVILRTNDPADDVAKVLPGGGPGSDKVYPGPEFTLIVSVNERVFSFRLVDNEFLDSIKP